MTSRHDIDAAVHRQQLQHLALRRSDMLAHMIVAVATIACLWRLYPIWVGPVWIALLGAVLFARDQIQRRYRLASADPNPGRHWGAWFTAGALATGLVWAMVSTVFATTDDLSIQGLALAVIGGMTIAGIARNAASTPMMIAFVAPILAITAAMLLVHPTGVHLGIAVMLGAFAIVLATTGRSLHQSVSSDLRLTLELVKTGTTLANAQGEARTGSWEVDAATRHILWSEEMSRIFDVRGSSSPPSIDLMLGAVHPEDRARVQGALADWLACRADLAVDHRVNSSDGRIRWVHQFGLTQQDAAGRPLRYTAIVHDITDRKQAEENLQFANVVMKTQLEASEDGILVISKEHKVISFNDRFSGIFNCPRSLLETGLHQGALDHVLGLVKNPEPYLERMTYFSANPGEDGQDELELADGRFIHRYTVTLNGPAGDYLGRAWFFRDVTEQKEALAQAVRSARLDPLTGLANRGAFVEDLRAGIATAARGEGGVAVLYIDLDHFKDVNDALGHPAGDQLLREVAARLTASRRPSDTIARFGGDEFAVIAADVVDIDAASQLAAKLIDVISQPYAIGGVPVRIGASVGIALQTSGDTDAETMLSQADLALYSAKAKGRSEHRAFTAAMDTEVRTRLALGAELHEAISEGQLFLLYQPQIHLGSGRVVGVEALVRWRHPTRGMLSPGLFIPVAEQTGIIGKLGQWVLTTACRQARAWLDAGAPSARVAINVSSLQFKAALAFETDIEAALAAFDLAPDCLELELTETVLMDAFKEHGNPFGRLRERGLTIAIDDFGTGYSSLDYLRRFPVDRIKIAQEFVRDIESGGGDAAIVKATIGLARELGIESIAEGVERQRQHDLLQAWGCDEAQGYLFAEPLPAEDILPLLCDNLPLRAVA